MDINFGIFSLNQTPMDWNSNTDRLIRVLEKHHSDCDFFIFSELVLSSYGCQDYFLSEMFYQKEEQAIKKVVAATAGKSVVFGAAIRKDGRNYTCAIYAHDQKIIGIEAKKVLARAGVHYEPRWFDPWKPGAKTTIDLAGQKNIAFGDLDLKVVDKDIKLKLQICEEAWLIDEILEQYGPEKRNKKYDLIINVSASHYSLNKCKRRHGVVQKNSKIFGGIYLYANQLGLDSGRVAVSYTHLTLPTIYSV